MMNNLRKYADNKQLCEEIGRLSALWAELEPGERGSLECFVRENGPDLGYEEQIVATRALGLLDVLCDPEAAGANNSLGHGGVASGRGKEYGR